jgi:hypothetical protein
MRYFTPSEFKRFCEDRALTANPILASWVEFYGLRIYGTARAKFGNSSQLQPPLAPSTQDTRVALGYSADETLLRSGSLRDSMEFEHWGLVAAVGTPDVRMLWAEVGTVTQPPRPLLRMSARENSLPGWIRLRQYTAAMVGINMEGGGVTFVNSGSGALNAIEPNTAGFIQLTSAMQGAKSLLP